MSRPRSFTQTGRFTARSSILLSLLAAFSLALVAACASHSSHAHAPGHWGYDKEDGPKDWCGLDPANTACCNGHEQSPIDIQTKQARAATPPKLVITYPSSTFTVLNNGHTVEAELEVDKARCGITLGGVDYDLKQFHVHTPSEHTINGKHSPLEVHLVHKSAAGDLAVIGLLVESGPANAELEKIWRIAPEHEGTGGVAVGVNLANVLPATRVTYRYAGSLTTPPCSEHVRWIVMQTPITMSEAQITKLEGLFAGAEFPEGNCRPVQPLGARTVELDSGSQ
jgi:carbonic anhydrase